VNKVTTTDLSAFRTKLQGFVQAHWQKAANVGTPPEIIFEPLTEGRKFARIVITQGSSRSAYGFVDLATGDLLKSASWKTPAKGKRGNIFDPDPLAGCTPYGMAYFRN
jgi:hypothetical protein